jgi:hypothetical protein
MGLVDNLWVIAAIVYVAGMFPLFYLYQAYPLDRFGDTITRATIISIFGAVGLLSLYIFAGAWGKSPSDEQL